MGIITQGRLLILMRHGNTFEQSDKVTFVGKHTDLPLTSHGRAQAQEMGLAMLSANFIPKTVFSGALRRQKETAEIVSACLSNVKGQELASKRNEALDEIDLGIWENRTRAEIEIRQRAQLSAWELRGEWPDDIFPEQKKDRLQALSIWLEQVRVELNKGDNVLAVTSNGVLRLIYSILLPDRWESLRESNAVGQCKVGTGKVCVLQMCEVPEVIGWNLSSEQFKESLR